MHTVIQASLRATLRERSDVVQVGPFLAAFDPHDDSPFRSYAIPDDDSDPTPEQIDELEAAFGVRGRVPRLEFLPAVAPPVQDALLAAGFTLDDRLAVMTVTRGGLHDVTPVPRVTVELVEELAALREAAAVQNAAYGLAHTTDADVERLRCTVAEGGVVALARSTAGEAVGSGLVTPPHGEFAELAAVGVLAPWRRRGIAAALAGALGRGAFAAGIPAILLMAYAAEQRIYARVGFLGAGEIIFMSRASPGGS